MTHEHDAETPRDDDTDGLWDPECAGDELRSLEGRLSRYRHRPLKWSVPEGVEQDAPEAPSDDTPWTSRMPVTPAPRRQQDVDGDGRAPIWRSQGSRVTRGLSLLAAAALLLFLFGESLGWFGLRTDPLPEERAPYMVEALEGLPEVQRRGVTHSADRLDVEAGDLLVCDDASRAALHVKSAGMVRMEPGTELRVDSAPVGGWRLYLERGQVTASIFAAPRLFQVGTPSGIAVDLGCEYTATVGDDGETILSVRTGQVSFEAADRKVYVPQGARVVAWPGRGPGTPVWNDAPGPLRLAVAQLDDLASEPAADLDASGSRAAVEELARISEGRHSLTLWHLLDHPHPLVSRRALEVLTELCPPPEDVAPGDIRAGRPDALALWRQDLQVEW